MSETPRGIFFDSHCILGDYLPTLFVPNCGKPKLKTILRFDCRSRRKTN